MPLPANKPSPSEVMSYNATAVVKICQDFLHDNKADDIVVIDVIKKFPLADYMIIATGTSARHIISLAQNLSAELNRSYRVKTLSVTGMEQGDWLLLDLGDVIVHLFQKTAREYYQLEKRWADN